MAATAFPLPGPTLFSHAPPQMQGMPGPTGGLAATPLPPSSPFPVGVRDNSRVPGMKTNGHVAYVVDVSMDDVGGYQGSRNELMFVESGNTRGRRVFGSRMRSLSMLNYHLRTRACKKAYGKLRYAVGGDGFLAHWTMFGSQKTDVPVYDRPDLGTVAKRSALPFSVGKEAMMWNYWLATARRGGINQGDHLWLLARLYTEPAGSGGNEFAGERTKRARVVDLVDAKNAEEHSEFIKARAAGVSVPASESEELVAMDTSATEEAERFWQLVPWSSPTHEPPPVQLYSGPDWIGSAIYVGIAGMRYESTGSWPGTERAEALAAVFPESSAYRDNMRECLPRVIVFLRSGRAPGC